jgi:histidine triad (HIT) family protein
MPCVFCEILRGERAAPVVREDAGTLAFLDHRPLFPGHVLVVPRQHRATMLELSPGETAALFGAAQLVGRAVVEGLGAEGFCVAVNNRVSQSVPHVHVHVVPRTRGDGLRGFFWPRHPYRDEAHVEQVRAAIAAAAARG